MEITVYRNGHYDIQQNLKIKAKNTLRKKGSELADKIDYFFTEFGR